MWVSGRMGGWGGGGGGMGEGDLRPPRPACDMQES